MRGLEQIGWLYDGVMSIGDRFGLRDWRRWLVRGAYGRTLEVGVGTGRNLPLFTSEARVIGLEPTRDVLHRARRRLPGVRLVVGRAEAMPFREGVFDTVVTSLVFCSVGDVPRGLSEVRRVLAPHGKLRMLEHVRSTNRLWSLVQDGIQPLWTRLTGGCHPNRRTEEAVTAAGFEIEAMGRAAQGTLRRFSAHKS